MLEKRVQFQVGQHPAQAAVEVRNDSEAVAVGMQRRQAVEYVGIRGPHAGLREMRVHPLEVRRQIEAVTFFRGEHRIEDPRDEISPPAFVVIGAGAIAGGAFGGGLPRGSERPVEGYRVRRNSEAQGDFTVMLSDGAR